MADLEAESGAQVAGYVVEVGSGRSVSHRAGARMPHASVFKALLAGVLLDRLDAAELAERLRWGVEDPVASSPVTEDRVGSGLTVRGLIAAMLRESDNTAANLLLERVGGPDGLEAALRDLGDEVTRTDRVEPELNSARPGDPRDTSTARALAATLTELVLGDVLPASRAEVLDRLLRQSRTGLEMIRSAVPASWVVGDRSGTGAYGTRTNAAVLRPPTGSPLVMVVLTRHPDDQDAEPDDELVADAAGVLLAGLAGTGR